MSQSKRKLNHFFGGLKLVDHKSESTQAPLDPAPIPKRLIIPIQQHIGEPALPVVNLDEQVKKGQLLADASVSISACVHAPSSGKIVAIGEYDIPHVSGLKATCIELEPDGKDEWMSMPPHSMHELPDMDSNALHAIIASSGIVGLGGAGFPTHIKLSPEHGPIHTLIVNGAECEPYISCDDMLMRSRPDEIVNGALIMLHTLKAKNCIIAIEDNKKSAYDAMHKYVQSLANNHIEIILIPTIYPTGGEKQLIKVLTGIEIPTKELPAKFGMVCHNVSTCAAIYNAVMRGRPLTSRIVTVSGNVSSPRNLDVLIGTPIKELLVYCGAKLETLHKVVVGGPMMGFSLNCLDAPITKTTSCIIAYATPIPAHEQNRPCIRCGKCATVCPVKLLPQQLFWYARSKELDKIQDYHLFDCIECGCCDYVCPSQIPLIQFFRFAKTEIWNQEREKKQSDVARRRHEMKLQRIEQEKAARAEKHKQKVAALSKSTASDANAEEKKATIQAAVERVKAARAQHPGVQPKNTDNLTEQQKQMITDVDKRRQLLRKRDTKDSENGKK